METLTIEQLVCLWFGRIVLGMTAIICILGTWVWLFDRVLSFLDVKRAFLTWLSREVLAKRFQTLRGKWKLRGKR